MERFNINVSMHEAMMLQRVLQNFFLPDDLDDLEFSDEEETVLEQAMCRLNIAIAAKNEFPFDDEDDDNV
jgi:hypothetical protein